MLRISTDRQPEAPNPTQVLKAYNTDKVRQLKSNKLEFILDSLRQKDPILPNARRNRYLWKPSQF
jgi:hypothetical protein